MARKSGGVMISLLSVSDDDYSIGSAETDRLAGAGNFKLK
jgi:hypothetical protein